jgi:hypothetical protein
MKCMVVTQMFPWKASQLASPIYSNMSKTSFRTFLLSFHTKQWLIDDNKKDHTHVPQAIFKIKDHKKDATCKKFMEPCNFQVPLGFPKKLICSNFKVFLEKDNQIK